MFAAIQAAMGLASFDARQLAFAGLGRYESRGHGEGCISNKHSKHKVAMDKRAALKARNRSRA